jgi:dihydrolipoamide dehydrogenase
VAAMIGQGGHKDLSLVPSCVYTAPECASVGLTQAQAEEKGIPVTVRRRLSLSNGKSLIDEDGRGFAKEVFDQQSGRLLGVQLMCGHASEMIGLLGLAIRQKATMDQLDETIFPHPTVSEFL